MTKILIFYPQLDKPLSGGQVIDFDFINQIRESDSFSMSFFQDSDLKSSSILSYNMYLLLHIRLFMKYDVIFMNSRTYPRMFLFVLLLRLLFFKGKIITYHHHYNFLIHKGIKRFVHRFFELSFLRLMSKVIVPSPYTLSLTQKFLKGSQIEYIEIGFDNDIINNKCSNPNQWLFVGTVESRKGVKYLVNVAEILKNRGIEVEFHVVGSLRDSQYVEELQNSIQIAGLEKNILLLGRLDEESLIKEYETSYGFSFPSLHEGYGMVLVEAMRFGLPIVAFNNSAMPFSVKNNYNGLIVENKNISQMADAIELLLNDKTLHDSLKSGAYEYVRGIKTHREMIDEMKQFIKEL